MSKKKAPRLLVTVAALQLFAGYYGRTADELLSALQDVTTGEYQRIKQFGVRLRDGDFGFIRVSYKGVEPEFGQVIRRDTFELITFLLAQHEPPQSQNPH